MRIRGKIVVPRLISYCMHRQQESTDTFQIQPITQTTVMEYATPFLLSDVLHCTNMNTDFIDFRK